MSTVIGEQKEWAVFENKGQRLFGVIHRPEEASEAAPVPGVVICHGFGGNKCGKHRLYVRIASLLASAGVAVLRFDFRGSGDSDGSFRQVDLASEVEDTVVAVEYLSSQRFVDKERIGLIGRSLGGAVAVLAAAELKMVKALALWAPVFDAAQWKKAWETAQVEGSQQALDEGFVAFDGQLTNLAFVQQFFAMDIAAVLKGLVHVPLLAIHGEVDERVGAHHMGGYETARVGVPDSTFVLLKNCGHDFNDVQEQQRLLQRTSDWLLEKLAR